MYKVFIYGSLKQGFMNSIFMNDCTFLGNRNTKKPEFKMISLGFFPGVIKSNIDKGYIMGELYEVDDKQLSWIDMLESNGDFYQRELVETNNNESAYMYLFLHADTEIDLEDGVVKTKSNGEIYFNWTEQC